MESESDDECILGSQCGRDERIRAVLKILRDGRISILDFLLRILQSDTPEWTKHRTGFFANPSGKLGKLFDCIFKDKSGRSAATSWVDQLALEVVSEKIATEMEVIKTSLMWMISSTTPDALLRWDIDAFIGPLVEKKAPTLGYILQTAAQTKRAKEKNKIKTCTTACNVIVAQLAKERSQNALFFAIPFTLFLWTNGASRQTIEALYRCSLCISFSSLTTLLHQLAAQSTERAVCIATDPHVLCWDNINISTSIFVEQRDLAPAKVQSGTFAILYRINANPVDMRLSPMLARALSSSGGEARV